MSVKVWMIFSESGTFCHQIGMAMQHHEPEFHAEVGVGGGALFKVKVRVMAHMIKI